MEFLETASSIVYVMMMMIMTMLSSRKCRLDGRDNKLVVWCSLFHFFLLHWFHITGYDVCAVILVYIY